MDYPRPCSERMGGTKEAGLKLEKCKTLRPFDNSTEKSMCHGLMHNFRLNMGRLIAPDL